ncbi:hypothetical protein BS47DRAFT_1265422, partial [Hydnum rufescens UP504]
GASHFGIGEYVLIRVPIPPQTDGSMDIDTMAGSGILPTFNETSPQHFGCIPSVNEYPDGSYEPQVYPVVSFVRNGGALAGYNQLEGTAYASLIPLPPLSHGHPTPELFGDRLSLGGWSAPRDSWLSVVLRKCIMTISRPASFLLATFKRMVPPLTMNSRLHRTRLQWASILSSGRPKDVIRAGLEEPALGFSNVPLIAESVDEDEQDADAAMRDELSLMATQSSLWAKELVKYLMAEDQEKEQMQELRAGAARL